MLGDIDVQTGVAIEALLAFVFTIVLIALIKKIKDKSYIPTFVALILRVLMIVGAKFTGASFNVRDRK